MVELHHFLAMGGYGCYIWPAYAAGAAILLFNVWWSLRQHRRTVKRLRLEADDE